MRKTIRRLGLIFVWLAPFGVQAGVNVFACEPEWSALAEAIGGEKVQVFSATHAQQDPHHIRARPSLIAKVRSADLLVCSGAGLEVGWLPILLQKAPARVQPGSQGYLMATEFVPLLEQTTVVDRSLGDIHPEGNPHVHLNPHNVVMIAVELTKRLKVISPDDADYFQTRYEQFSVQWEQHIRRWESEATHLSGVLVVVHHKSLSYLLDWLKLKPVASLEPKPGIAPTTSHLATLVQLMNTQSVRLILRAPYEPTDASEWLSKRSQVPALVLPYTVGGDELTSDLVAVFDRSISLLNGVLRDHQ